MTVNAITDTKKGRTGIAPTYLHTTPPTQLNSTQLTTPKEKSGLQEERSYKSLYKSPILQ